MDMMTRRRAMMGAGSIDPTLLYSLKNYTIEQLRLDTKVAPLTADMDATIAMDIDITSNPTTNNAVASIYKLFVVYGPYRDLCIGKYSRGDSVLSCWWMATSNSDYSRPADFLGPVAGRKRIIVTHEANGNSIKIYWKSGTGSVYPTTITKTYTANNSTLRIGGGDNNTQSLPPGTINSCEVYSRIWTADERTVFFS